MKRYDYALDKIFCLGAEQVAASHIFPPGTLPMYTSEAHAEMPACCIREPHLLPLYRMVSEITHLTFGNPSNAKSLGDMEAKNTCCRVLAADLLSG